MAFVLSDNIISPLGFTSADNYLSVKSGKSGIQVYAPGSHGIPEGFTASLFSDAMMAKLYADRPEVLAHAPWLESRFGLLAFSSAHQALEASGVDVEHQKVAFILSTTKGTIEDWSSHGIVTGNPLPVTEKSLLVNEHLAQLAQQIALALGIRSKAIVVCNACISGLSAIILANRLLDEGAYDAAVVCGADCPGKFIISGFQSLKATSTVPCRPFDMERFGLNLGEAVATLVLGRQAREGDGGNAGKVWNLRNGYIKNDAFHVTSPAKDAIGLCHALQETLQGVEVTDLAFVNAHGTATLFNDQMESVAIEKAGLSGVPTNALKGYFGHTLGAAGILETIISLHAAEDATVLGTRGFEELGVSGKVDMSGENRDTDKVSFVKMLSGFGGCNASILAQKTEKADLGSALSADTMRLPWVKTHSVKISPQGVTVDGHRMEKSGEGDFVTHLYKSHVGSYPKFYKMDALSRLGFVASELLLSAEGKERFVKRGDRAVVLCNRSSSICSDKKYMQSIQDEENYFPSPSVFVYTLPNIVTGEIAIRNGYQGETSFYLLPDQDEKLIDRLIQTAFDDLQTKSVLGGWLDYEDDAHYEAELFIAEVKA